MAELINKKTFIEDIKTEIVNLAMDGLKGTPRDRSYLYEMIDRINEQPTTTEAELRANVIDEFAEKFIYKSLCEGCSFCCICYEEDRQGECEDWKSYMEIASQMKGEKEC